jgi:hypothetical protein
MPTRRTELQHDLAAVQEFVEQCIFGRKKKVWIATLVTFAAVVAGAAVMLQVVRRRR